MITADGLRKANEKMKTINIKGKEYVQVTERIKAFRELCPEGSITTEIVTFGDGQIVMKTTITDEDGRVLATGHAMEKEDSSYINKTSYVENCETSSWGRALSALNLGIDASIASAEELVNAVVNQGYASNTEKKAFMKMCEKAGVDPTEILAKVGWKKGQKLTIEQHGKALVIVKEILDSNGQERL